MFKSHTPNTVENLRPLIDEYIKNMGGTEITNVDYIINNMVISLQAGTGRLLSDTLEDPSSMVWASVGKSLVLDKNILACSIVYTKESKRGSVGIVKNLLKSIELAAQFSNCDQIYGASWAAKSAETSKRMWIKSGFVEQETYFVKNLN